MLGGASVPLDMGEAEPGLLEQRHPGHVGVAGRRHHVPHPSRPQHVEQVVEHATTESEPAAYGGNRDQAQLRGPSGSQRHDENGADRAFAGKGARVAQHEDLAGRGPGAHVGLADIGEEQQPDGGLSSLRIGGGAQQHAVGGQPFEWEAITLAGTIAGEGKLIHQSSFRRGDLPLMTQCRLRR